MNNKTVGVIGAGMMGAEIALCFSKAGFQVILNDITPELAMRGKEKQAEVLDRSIKKGNFDPGQKGPVLDRVKTSSNIQDLAACDFVVEAVLEALDVKAGVLKKLDSVCKESCVIASNTSSISITKLAASVGKDRQRRFLGTHFNSPASIMKLVELIPGELTAPETVDFTVELLREIEKESVKVKDVTGFALNRLFHCFYAEAFRLLEEGVASKEDIDKVCLYGLGHPVGIFKLLDITGHDLNLKVDEIMFNAYGERFRPSQTMRRMVDAGMLGRKSGAGLYEYEKNRE
jgi:3-hydroxybutyryl-CoA dehydrogenase